MAKASILIDGEIVEVDRPIVEIKLEEAQAEALARVDMEHAKQLRLLTGNASREEVDTWTIKAAAATAYLASTATPEQSAMIEAEAAGDGTTPADLATIIATKSAAYQNLVGLAGGLRRGARAAVTAATTPAEVEAALASFATQAEAAIAAFTAQT